MQALLTLRVLACVCSFDGEALQRRVALGGVAGNQARRCEVVCD
jgi:hypothetical protein